MRLFVALELEEQLKTAAGAWLERLASTIDRRYPRAVTWTPAERLHVTLHFFGERNETELAAIQAAMAPAFPQAPFTLALGGAGTFPPAGRPRVIWLDIRQGRDAVVTLAGHVRDRLVAAGLAPAVEVRPFQPHITIGRVKDGSGGLSRALREALARNLPTGTSRVEAVTLMHSRPTAHGHVYEAVMRSLLTG